MKSTADLLALHWTAERLVVVPPARGRETPVFAVPLPEAAGGPAELGGLLKTELAARRVSARRAAVVLPRSAAVVRKLTLPDAPDDELPDLVRLQAATKVATPLDRLRLDYVPLPPGGASLHAGGREVLLATVPGDVADAILNAVRAAGLEPVSIGLSPFGVAALLAGGAGSALILTVDGSSAEVTLARDGAVLFSHPAELHGDGPDEDRRRLTAEISRAVVAADHLSAERNIDRVILVGPPDLLGPLAGPLKERYGGEVVQVDRPSSLGLSWDGDGEPPLAAFAAASGHLGHDGSPRLDLLNPRKRIEKPDRRKQRAIALAAAALLAVAGLYGWSVVERGRLEDELAVLKQRDADLDKEIKNGEPIVAADALVGGWLADRADWPERIAAFSAALPGTDRAYLTDLSLEPGPRDTVGRIRATGLAKTRGDAESLQQSLAGRGYRVSPKPITEGGRDREYPVKFEIDLLIPRDAAPETPTKNGGPATAGGKADVPS